MPVRNYITCLLLFLLPGFLPGQKSGQFFKKLPQEDGTLYFLKAAKFKSTKGKATLLPDFTYLYPNHPATSDSVLVNLSVYQRSSKGDVKQVTFQHSTGQFTVNQVTLMFVEKKGKKWHSRYSVKMTPSFWIQLLEANAKQEITLAFTDSELHFVPTGKWSKQASIAHQILKLELK